MQRSCRNPNILDSESGAIASSSEIPDAIMGVDSSGLDQEVNDASQPNEPPRSGKTLFSQKELKKARKFYSGLEGLDRTFSALRYGFGDHQPHTYHDIKSKMNISMAEVRECQRRALGLQEQPETEPLKGQAFLLSRLEAILPGLDNQEQQMAIMHYGLGRHKCSIQEINKQLFHNTPLGELRIKGFLQALFNKIYAFEDRSK